jgi:hypothetical protein
VGVGVAIRSEAVDEDWSSIASSIATGKELQPVTNKANSIIMLKRFIPHPSKVQIGFDVYWAAQRFPLHADFTWIFTPLPKHP